MSTQFPGAQRRVIGPIPPRDKHGKLMLDPIPGKALKLNILGEPTRDKDGQPIEIDVDLRHPLDYMLYEQGATARKGATDGLSLWDVTVDPEPIYRVWAKDEQHALRLLRTEGGYNSFREEQPKATKVK